MNKDFKYCYNCGQKLPEIANFCIRCGANQNEINTETENIEVAPVYHQESTTKPAEKQVVGKVFDELAKRYETRNGGYTRIIKLKERVGDDALTVKLELV